MTTWTEPAELKEARDKKAAAEPAAEEATAVAAVAPAASNLASAQAKADAAAGAVQTMTRDIDQLCVTLTNYATPQRLLPALSHSPMSPAFAFFRGVTPSAQSETSCIILNTIDTVVTVVSIYTVSAGVCPPIPSFRASAISHTNQEGICRCFCCRSCCRYRACQTESQLELKVQARVRRGLQIVADRPRHRRQRYLRRRPQPHDR